MPKQTFLNLPAAKKELINAALLDEFSTKPLFEAKVSAIVSKTNIARGTFYKYFPNLKDAYLYMYGLAIEEIHLDFSKQSDAYLYLEKTQQFLRKISQSKYYNLIKMHILYNQNTSAYLKKETISAKVWAISILCHQTIKEALQNPKQTEQLLNRLEIALQNYL